MQAIADFTKVLELDSTNANAYFNRGSTHDSIGAYDKARAAVPPPAGPRGAACMAVRADCTGAHPRAD